MGNAADDLLTHRDITAVLGKDFENADIQKIIDAVHQIAEGDQIPFPEALRVYAESLRLEA